MTLTAGILAAQPASASGGTEVADESYQFVAQIIIGTPGLEGSRSCTGALVHYNYVITSKACFAEGGQTPVTGTPPRPTTASFKGLGGSYTVTRIVVRPDRDVALAELDRPEFWIRPVDWSSVGPAPAGPVAGDVLRVVGFGRTANEWVPDRAHTTEVSVQRVGSATLDIIGRDPAAATTCKGDAGGPTFREVPADGGPDFLLFAVHHTSGQLGCFGEPQASTSAGAVETRVDDLYPWVKSVTEPWTGATGGPVAPQAGEQVPQSIVEGFSYPNADRILAEQNVKLISGDGHIILVDCATPVTGDIGLLKVRTTDETIGADGIGRVCFKILAAKGLLTLEVPGVYEIRGDGQKTGTGHQVTAIVKPDDGEKQVVQVRRDGSTQVGQGADPDPNTPPTVLLQLAVNG